MYLVLSLPSRQGFADLLFQEVKRAQATDYFVVRVFLNLIAFVRGVEFELLGTTPHIQARGLRTIFLLFSFYLYYNNHMINNHCVIFNNLSETLLIVLLL